MVCECGDKAAYLIRQFISRSLYDRLNTRPFLTISEKKWVAYQLLRALESVHAEGVVHGDLKCENILLTSDDWLLLGDFAPFKPIQVRVLIGKSVENLSQSVKNQPFLFCNFVTEPLNTVTK